MMIPDYEKSLPIFCKQFVPFIYVLHFLVAKLNKTKIIIDHELLICLLFLLGYKIMSFQNIGQKFLIADKLGILLITERNAFGIIIIPTT